MCALLTIPWLELFQGLNLERVKCCWDHLGCIRDWTSPRPLYKLLRSWCVGMKIYSSCSCLRHTSCISPLLIKTATYQSGVACLFLQSLLILHVGGKVTDFTDGSWIKVSVGHQLLWGQVAHMLDTWGPLRECADAPRTPAGLLCLRNFT